MHLDSIWGYLVRSVLFDRILQTFPITPTFLYCQAPEKEAIADQL